MKRLKFIIITCIYSLGLLCQNPELLIQKGHKDQINFIRFSPNGSFFATGGNDNAVLLTDVATGFIFKSYQGHTEPVHNIIFSPDNKKMISVSQKEIIIWDLENEKRLYTLDKTVDNNQMAIAVSPDSKEIVYHGSGLERFDLLTLKPKEELGEYSGDMDYLAYSADGKLLMVIRNSVVNVIDRNTGAEKFSLGTQNSPKCFFITGDSHYYYCANENVNWQKWDLFSGKLEETRIGRKNSNESVNDNHFAIVNAGHNSVAVQTWKDISIYDLWSGRLLNSIKLDEKLYKDTKLISGAFNPQGNILVTVGSIGKKNSMAPLVRSFDVRSGKVINESTGFESSVDFASVSPDDKCIAIGGPQQAIRVWQMDKTGGHMVNLNEKSENSDGVFWSPDSRVIVNNGPYACITDLNTGESRPANKHFTYFSADHEYPDEQFAISKDFKLQSSYRIVDYSNGKTVCVADPRTDYYSTNPYSKTQTALGDERKFAPDNRTLLSFNNYYQLLHINILDVTDCKKTAVLSFSCGFSFDMSDLRYDLGNTYVAAGVNSVKVYDYRKQEKILDIPARGPRTDMEFVSAVALNAKENLLAISYLDTTIEVYELPAGKKLKTLHGHDLPATSLCFKNKSDILLSASPDSKVIFWNPLTGDQLGTLATVDSNDFIIFTPENYYFATRSALRKMAFRKGKKIFPFEQFDLKYNRPDIIFKKLELASATQIKMYNLAYKKRLQKAGFTEEMLGNDYYLPETEVANKYDLPSLKYEDTMSFRVRVKDLKYGLKRINVFVNEVSVFGSKGMALNGSPKEKSEIIQLKLSSGINRIQVSVTNEKGLESLREVFEVNCQKMEKKPDLYLLAIGVSEFKDNSHNLKYAAKDAGDLAKAFEANPQYGKVNIKKILNAEASAANILKASEFLNQAGEDDVVMLYVSSHGLLDDKLDYYIATNDVNFNNPSEKGLPYQDLEDILEKCHSRNRLLMIDACHSGELDKDETQLNAGTVSSNTNVVATKAGNYSVAPKTGLNNSFTYMRALFDDVSKGIGATVISAAAGTEFALESPQWNNGVFTYAILNALKSKEADFDKNGLIQVSELREYVTKKVTELTEGRQVPDARKQNQSRDFIIR